MTDDPNPQKQVPVGLAACAGCGRPGQTGEIAPAPGLGDSQFFRLITENVSDVIWVAEYFTAIDPDHLPRPEDLTTAAARLILEQRFTYISPSVESLLRYSPAESLRLGLRELLTPASCVVLLGILERALGTGQFQTQTAEMEFVAKDGSTRWCEVTGAFYRNQDGRVAGALGVARDLTARLETQRALRQSETRLRRLFENLPDFVVLVDRDASIQFANHGVPGAPVERLLGSNGFSHIVPEHQPVCQEAFQRAFAGRSVEKVEIRDVYGLWWECRVVPIMEDEVPHHAMIICTDVTNRRLAEAAIQKEQQRLRWLLDMYERDRSLAAYEIHDALVQPLISALMQLEAAGRTAPGGGDRAAALDLLRRTIQEGRRLMSGMRPSVLDDFGLISAIEHLLAEAREAECLEIEFHEDVDFERLTPPLEMAVYRIVQEGILNARRHSGSHRVRVSLVEQNACLRIEVQDWGVGFDPRDAAGDRFGVEGIRQRARLFGGRAEITSAAGTGTHIVVELPLAEADVTR
jgi:PAS domain S-box-containing protein